MMTFAEFQATGRDCDNLNTAIGFSYGPDEPATKGRIYLDSLYIEDTSNWGQPVATSWEHWSLTLGRETYWDDDLTKLELRLYRWALLEGYTVDGTDSPASAHEVTELADNALNAACKCVQDALGIKDGDLAGSFFSGPHEIRDILTSYILAELRA